MPLGPKRVRKDMRWLSGSRCWEGKAEGMFWVVGRFTVLVKEQVVTRWGEAKGLQKTGAVMKEEKHLRVCLLCPRSQVPPPPNQSKERRVGSLQESCKGDC